MEVVIEVFFTSIGLSIFHLFAALVAVTVLIGKFKRSAVKQRGLAIISVSTLLTYFFLGYVIASQTCAGRSDFSYCTGEVMLLASKMAIVLLPIILIFGILGLYIGLKLTRPRTTNGKKGGKK
jgi:hypothetical protein